MESEEGKIAAEHEKKQHEKHAEHHAPRKKIKRIVLWQGATLALGLLLVFSIITHGFTCLTGCAAENGSSSAGKEIVILTDSRCTDCTDMISLLKPRLQQVFASHTITEVDYADEEGKELYESSGVQFLPAVLFTDDIESDQSYSEISSYLDPAGEYLSLRIGSQFDPAAEICTNGQDDNNDGMVDCKDPTCAAKTVCREEQEGRLDVFVMSQCPYGTQALDSMEEVLAAFGEDLEFHINYIASETAPGVFSSLHGQPEVNENIRELCAIKHYPEKYMDYILCRNKAITSTNWESCATEAKFSTATMKACSEGDEGKQLLSENINLAGQLGIGASPTWLVNNKYTFSGIDAETVKTNFCRYHPGLEGCGSTLSANAAVSGQC